MFIVTCRKNQTLFVKVFFINYNNSALSHLLLSVYINNITLNILCLTVRRYELRNCNGRDISDKRDGVRQRE